MKPVFHEWNIENPSTFTFFELFPKAEISESLKNTIIVLYFYVYVIIDVRHILWEQLIELKLCLLPLQASLE